MRRTAIGTAGALAISLALTACGSDGTDGSGATQLGTLAYVETECRNTSEGFVERQALRIRQGDRAPVTVFGTPTVGPLPGRGYLCPLLTQGRVGTGSIAREAFQLVTVSPDGTSVVFEVTDEFSVRPPLPLNLPPEQKGIFWVRADGTGLRRLSPPSRERAFFIENGGVFFQTPALSFSPSGGTIAFVDKGPDAYGQEADQIFTIDVATAARTQVTHLPPAAVPPELPSDAPLVALPLFVDDRTISFYTSANPNGLNPEGGFLPMTIKTDGSGLEVPVPISVALPGSTLELRFVITGNRPHAINVILPGEPINPEIGGAPSISEIFVIDEGRNVLQLTNFHRIDTGFPPIVDVDQKDIYFAASADPLGTNPSENCQLFSIDRTGADLRQLTNFGETEHSVRGCYFGARQTGCALYLGGWQDPHSRALLFLSNCDPLGTNPNGGQIFSIQPDGSGLRQLTDSRGLVEADDGTFIGELPGPWAYGPYQ